MRSSCLETLKNKVLALLKEEVKIETILSQQEEGGRGQDSWRSVTGVGHGNSKGIPTPGCVRFTNTSAAPQPSWGESLVFYLQVPWALWRPNKNWAFFFFFLHFFTFFFFLCLPSLAGRGPFFTLLSFPASKPRLRVCPHSAPSQLCHCGARSFYRRICRWTGASPEPRSYPSGGGTGLCGTRDSWILMGSFFTFSVERDRHLEGEALSSG